MDVRTVYRQRKRRKRREAFAKRNTQYVEALLKQLEKEFRERLAREP